MSKKAIKTLKNLFLPLFILSFFIVFPFHPCEAKESETDILYTVQLKKLHSGRWHGNTRCGQIAPPPAIKAKARADR